MKKKKFLLAIAVLFCSFGFSQNAQLPVKIFIGNTFCGENVNVKISRDQLLKEGKLKIIVFDKDTITNMSFTMQMSKGKDLTEKMYAVNNLFTPQMIANIKYTDTETLANKKDPNTETIIKKIWVENIAINYKNDHRLLPMFTILVTN
ncbi:MAG: hypothetical protein NTZ33_04175 [Bacteroidetes bacterium]|nr:hypothetical protein [Bacteroidota bacterium]